LEKFRGGKHKNLILAINYGWTIEADTFFIDMKLCRMSLRDLMEANFKDSLGASFLTHPQRNHPLLPLLYWEIVQQIAGGIAFIHSLGEVHRDLKPENSERPFNISNNF
jgi:serine/threonine protein kinase